jgi:YVTN family beta-propeller protein
VKPVRGAAALLCLLGCALLLAGAAGDREEPPRWTQSVLDYWEEGGLLFVAHRYAGTVVALDHRSGRVAWKRRVGRLPHRLQRIVHAGGADLLVSCQGSAEIWALDPRTGRVRARHAVGPTPHGFALVGNRYLVTALHALHRVVVWDLATGREVRRVAAGRFPTAVLALGGEVWVAHFFDSRLTVLDGESFAPRGEVEGGPRLGQTAALLPDSEGRHLFLPQILANETQPDLHLANTLFPVVSVVDARARGYLPERRLGLAFVDRPVNGPEALAWFRGGRGLLAANSRSDDLSLVDPWTPLAIAHIEVGRHPLGVAVDRAGARAFVANTHEHTVSVVDLATFRETVRWRYGEEALPPAVARGRDLFHDAGSARMVSNQWVSCSNCHPGGHSDGRVWRLPGRPPLRTKDLHGLAATLPGGWLGALDELQDEEVFIRDFHQGTGLSPTAPHPPLGRPNAGLSADLDALAAYVYWLRFEPSPLLERGKLSPAAERGRRTFESAQTGCLGCHPPPHYTVNARRDGGRFAGLLDPEPSPLPAPVDVPSLLGLWAQPRLLHDGRAERPLDVFLNWNRADRHGRTSHLSFRELEDLEAFLLSLPYRE